MASPPIPIPPNIVDITGPTLVGAFLNWGLHGALGVQAYMYYLSFPKDRILIKALVAFWFSIETLQTILLTRDTFSTFATHYGSVEALNQIMLNWFTIPVVTGFVSGTVQLYYCYRVWQLSSNIILTAGIVVVALTSSIAAFVTGGIAQNVKTYSRLQQADFASTTIWFAGSAICDVIIALSMTILLLQKDTAFHKTKLVLRKLVRLTIETGTLTATFAIIDVILFVALPGKTYYIVPAHALGKLYSNSALATLNSRMKIKGGREDEKDPIELSAVSSTSAHFPRTGPLNVSFTTTTTNHVDPHFPDKTDYAGGQAV